MNTIAGFRLCKLTDKELLKRVDTGCDDMYKTGKIPDRHIPAQPERDFDLILGELLVRFDRYSKGEPQEVSPPCTQELEPGKPDRDGTGKPNT